DRLSGLRTSDALVGDAYWDTGLGKAAVALAVPIRQADGRYAGALMAKINLRAVSDVLQRFAPRDVGGGGGSGGDFYVMTDQGRLILTSRVSSAELMRTKLPPATAQALLDREGTAVEYKRADGREVIGTLRRVPALRWAARCRGRDASGAPSRCCSPTSITSSSTTTRTGTSGGTRCS